MSRTAGDGLLISDGEAFHFRIDGPWCAAILSCDKVSDFLRNHLVASEDDIHDGHGADDLARRGDERRVSEFFSDTRHFREKRIVFISDAHFFHLVQKISI